MEQVINEILQAESLAQEIVKEARFLKQNLDKITAEEREKLKKDLFERAENRIEKVAAQEEEFTKQSCAEIEKKYSLLLEQFRLKKEENFDAWVETIYRRVIGDSV